ncbi:hypothetical protein L9F63_027454, partial [Diploptera punctata]
HHIVYPPHYIVSMIVGQFEEGEVSGILLGDTRRLLFVQDSQSESEDELPPPEIDTPIQ